MRGREIEQGATEECNTEGSPLSAEYLFEVYLLTSKQSPACLVFLQEAIRPFIDNSLNQLVQISFCLYSLKIVKFLANVALPRKTA